MHNCGLLLSAEWHIVTAVSGVVCVERPGT